MFTLEQLVSFGEYLLSDERIARVQEERAEHEFEHLGLVHPNDVSTWLKKQNIVN